MKAFPFVWHFLQTSSLCYTAISSLLEPPDILKLTQHWHDWQDFLASFWAAFLPLSIFLWIFILLCNRFWISLHCDLIYVVLLFCDFSLLTVWKLVAFWVKKLLLGINLSSIFTKANLFRWLPFINSVKMDLKVQLKCFKPTRLILKGTEASGILHHQQLKASTPLRKSRR